MKLQNDEQMGSPEAGVLSVSLTEAINNKFVPVKTQVNLEEELWEQISEELARDGSAPWRMWR